MGKKLKTYLMYGDALRLWKLAIELINVTSAVVLDGAYILTALSKKETGKAIKRVTIINTRMAKISDILAQMNEVISTNEEEEEVENQ